MSKKRQNAGRNEARRRADASLACVRLRPGCLPPEISRNEGYEVRFSPFFSFLSSFFFFKSRPSSSPELNHKVLVEGKEKVCFDDWRILRRKFHWKAIVRWWISVGENESVTPFASHLPSGETSPPLSASRVLRFLNKESSLFLVRARTSNKKAAGPRSRFSSSREEDRFLNRKPAVHPVEDETADPHSTGCIRMQIRPLFPSVVGAPPPSSGVHCATGTYERIHTGKLEYWNVLHIRAVAPSKYINNNIRGGSGIRYNYSPWLARR